MAVFINKEIDFNNEHADFLKKSYVAQEIFKYVNEELAKHSKDKNKNIYFITPILKGFLENIIKNDLPLQAVSKIDHKWLIDKNNSLDVKNMYYKIFFPSEEDSIKYNQQIIEAQNLVKEIFIHINIWIFKQTYDPVEYIKQEFKKTYSLNNEKKNGI
jgi:hypothetical protein